MFYTLCKSYSLVPVMKLNINYAMKTYGMVHVEIHFLLTSALAADELSHSLSVPGKYRPVPFV
jgi:hypothetical protein